jgi:5-methyltetrahydropteroyltriglutamate--homocysteine methyltransferase
MELDGAFSNPFVTDKSLTVEVVAQRIRDALEHIDAERLVVAPDCGMKYLSRETAFAKLCALVDAAEVVRTELGAAS